jgi:hypothetical protein
MWTKGFFALGITSTILVALASCGSPSATGAGGTGAGGGAHAGGGGSGGGGAHGGGGSGASGGGNAWAGILAPDRATDWALAGIPGGIPHRTTICANVAAGEAVAAIQAKLDACPENQVVKFGPGTFDLSASIYANKGIVLRGSGPTKTTINLTGGDIFLGAFGQGGLGGYLTDLGSTDWTGGLSRGSTVLTLQSTTGIKAGQRILLDQHNAPYVYPFGVEGECVAGNSCGRNDCTQTMDTSHPDGSQCPSGTTLQTWGSDNRAQLEIVEIASVDSPTQITIKAPGVAYDHPASLAPQAFWWNTSGAQGPGNIKYAGVEDMTVNANGQDDAISMPSCDYCWVKNVTVTQIARAGIFFFWGYRDEVRDSYFSASNMPGGPTQYGIEVLNSSLVKIENNIFFGVTSNILPEASYGLVAGYNYVRNTASGAAFGSFEPHLSHNYLHLYEGNVVDAINYDNSWGSSSHNTLFRNRLWGNSPNKTNYRTPLFILAHSHYMNVVGNVLGDPTYHSNYVCDQANQQGTDDYIYDLGFYDGCVGGITPTYPYDTVSESSLMRWGNWDAATWKANGNTNGVRYCTGKSAGNPSCTTSETDSADPDFPGLASPNKTLPASFYLSGKPSWFGAAPWPPIGPDVECAANCTADTANHAAMIPAQRCYASTAKDGNGFLTAFDAATCYGQ